MPLTSQGIGRTPPTSLHGGLNTTFQSVNLSEVELQQAENVVIDLDNTIRKRNGFLKRGDVVPDGGNPSSKIQGYGEYHKIASNQWVEWAVRNGKFYYRNRGVSAWSNAVLPVDFNTSAEVNGIEVFSHLPTPLTSGTVTATFDVKSLMDTTKVWTVDAYKDKWLVLLSGTARGQTAKIANNTSNKLTFYSSIELRPDATTTYAVYEAEKLLILGDAVGNLIKFDGNQCLTITNSPKGNLFTVWQQRLCVSGVSGSENAVYMSQVGNIEFFEINSQSFSIASPQDFTSLKGKVVGLKTMTTDAERLFVYTDKILYDIIYSSGLIVRERDLSFGAINHRGITKVDGSPTNIATDFSTRMFGNRTQTATGITVDDIGYKIDKQIENALNISKHSAVYVKNALYINMQIGGVVGTPINDTVFVYNTLRGSWTKFTGTYCSFLQVEKINETFTGAGYDGYIYEYKSDNHATRFVDDIATAINALVETKDMVSDSSNEKTFSCIRVWAGNEATVASDIYVDAKAKQYTGQLVNNANYTKLEVVPLFNGTTNIKPVVMKQFYMVKRGSMIAFKIQNNASGQDLKILKIEVGYTLNDNRSSYLNKQ